MFISFDEERFNIALKEKDYTRLKVNTVSAINNDPTFSGNEISTVIEKLKEQVPEIFEDEKRLEYEEYLDECDWNKEYFSKLTFYFQNNFAESRIKKIKEVGKKVYSGSQHEKQYAALHGKIGNTMAANPIKAPRQKIRQTLQRLVIPITLIITVVALVLLLIKIIR